MEVRSGMYPNSLRTLAFYINLIHPQDNVCKAPCSLIMDHVTSGYILWNNSFYQTPVLDSMLIDCSLGHEGVFRTINAVREDRTLAFLLTHGNSTNQVKECEDSPYALKLSEIMERIGNPLEVPADQTGHIDSSDVTGWEDLAQIKSYQNAYRINRHGKTYFYFHFTLENIGSKSARQVIFKDIVPNGLKIIESSVKLDGKKADYDILGRRLLVNIPDMDPGTTLNLTFICEMESETCVTQTNSGVLSYVAWHAIKENDCTKMFIIVQITNIKGIDKIDIKWEVPYGEGI